MRTPANIAKHPIHPMLVPIPIGLWIFSLVCDLISLAGYPGAWTIEGVRWDCLKQAREGLSQLIAPDTPDGGGTLAA